MRAAQHRWRAPSSWQMQSSLRRRALQAFPLSSSPPTLITPHSPPSRVCGMVILHRHGERAPMVNFWATGTEVAAAEEEERRWLKRLPKRPELELLNSHFPVQSAATRTPRDSKSRPFGCLTENGLESMRNLGRSIKKLHPGVLEKGAQQSQDDQAGDDGASPAVQFDVSKSGGALEYDWKNLPTSLVQSGILRPQALLTLTNPPTTLPRSSPPTFPGRSKVPKACSTAWGRTSWPAEARCRWWSGRRARAPSTCTTTNQASSRKRWARS